MEPARALLGGTWTSTGHLRRNVGLAHAYAGTCALDIDNATLAGPALAAFGVDLAALLTAPDAIHIRSGRAGRDKLLFRLRDPLPSINRSGREGFELRCAASNGTTAQCVLPPSIHPDTGKPYQRQGDWRRLPDIPADLLALWHRLLEDSAPTPRAVPQPRRQRRKLPDRIPEGARDNTLLSLAAGFVRQGLTLTQANWRVQQINTERCDPPLCATEVDGIVARAFGYGSTGYTLTLHAMEDAPEWKALEPQTRDIVRMAFRRYDSTNNGNIALTFDDFREWNGHGNRSAFYRHRNAAVAAGFLRRTREGGNAQSGRKPDLFAIETKWLSKARQVSN